MNGKETRMDADAPIDIPIRLERWDGHDILQEVETIILDARPVLDMIDYDGLPEPDALDEDYVATKAQEAGLLKEWDGPFTVMMPDCAEYPAYLDWRRTHRVIPGAKARFSRLRLEELRLRYRRTEEEQKRLTAEIKETEREIRVARVER